MNQLCLKLVHYYEMIDNALGRTHTTADLTDENIEIITNYRKLISYYANKFYYIVNWPVYPNTWDPEIHLKLIVN